MRHSSVARSAIVLLAACALVALTIPLAGYAATPNVRPVTPANITIDGSDGDWDSQSLDFLADMYEAGKPEKRVLSKLYARYDCGTETMYVQVVDDRRLDHRAVRQRQLREDRRVRQARRRQRHPGRWPA